MPFFVSQNIPQAFLFFFCLEGTQQMFALGVNVQRPPEAEDGRKELG